jgi:hypothetical protein
MEITTSPLLSALFVGALSTLSAHAADLLARETFADAANGISINGYQSVTAGYAPGLSGAWTTNVNPSPYTFAPTGAQKFFRAQAQ